MKKRVLCIILGVVLLLGLSVSVFAAQDNISVIIDNKEVRFTTDTGKPFVDENGRTQVPLRVVMEQYGCQVEWDNVNRTAVLTKDGKTVVVPVGKAYIIVDGMTVPMDTSALLQDGRIYLPIRSVLEAFGAEVAWNNGEVSVASPANNNFENIYVDNNGDVIYELANGNKVNVGSLPRGKDGRDGVSVTNAYVDGSGNLMIELSSGKTINAGNVSVGGNMNGLTFADYAVGTKFYLTQPTGAFDVPIKVNDVSYAVEFDEIYYELTEKHNDDDENVWRENNSSSNYFKTVYRPYEVTIHIKGKTEIEFAGGSIYVSLSDGIDLASECSAKIADDGTFVATSEKAWYKPKDLFLTSVHIIVPTTPSTPPTPTVPTVEELVKNFVGTYQLLSNPEKTVTVEADGTLMIDGTEYETTYTREYSRLKASFKNGYMYFEDNQNYVSVCLPGSTSTLRYYRDGTWESLSLTKDNFFDYFEFSDNLYIEYNTEGEAIRANISNLYRLKNEVRSKIIVHYGKEIEVTVTADSYKKQYSIDYEKGKYSVSKEKEYIGSQTLVRKTDRLSSYDGYNTIALNSINLALSGEESIFFEYTLTDVIGTLYFTK